MTFTDDSTRRIVYVEVGNLTGKMATDYVDHIKAAYESAKAQGKDFFVPMKDGVPSVVVQKLP